MAVLEYKTNRYPVIDKIVIGRQKTCDLPLQDQGASREHCKVFLDSKNRIWLEDLGSANGTKLNGDIIKAPTKLSDGDVIQCSKSNVTVHLDASEKELNRSSSVSFKPDALVGTLIAGHRIQNIIGSTNIVTVYTARQLSLDRDVVLKVVHPSFADADSPLARDIDDQTKAAARINHQSIAQVHECGTEDNFIWSSMEYIDGEMLFDLLDREGQLAPDIALMIAEKIADGMQSAHDLEIVHRALNPRNIMLSKDGRVKVVDLVLEHFLRYHLEQKGMATPEDHADYLAPELLRGKKGDGKSDIYGLGCILFQMLTGQAPYVFDSAAKTAQAHIKNQIPDITQHCPDLPPSLKQCIDMMLDKNPESRQPSMAVLRDQLAQIRKTLPSKIGQQKARKTSLGSNTAKSARQLRSGDRRATQSAAIADTYVANADDTAMQKIFKRLNHKLNQQLHAIENGRGKALLVNAAILLVVAFGIWYAINHINMDTLFPSKASEQKQQAANDDPRIITPDSNLEALSQKTKQKQDARETEQVNKTLSDLWERNKAKIEQNRQDHEWDGAEYTLRRTLPQLKNNQQLYGEAQHALQQVLSDGRSWYAMELLKINAGDSIEDLRQQSLQLSTLRSKVLNESRPDVEARYQQALTGLERHLARAKQSAIRFIEDGQLKQLQATVKKLDHAFSDTSIEPMYTQFAALVNEAQHIAYLGDWQSTRSALLRANSAEDRLSAGAALMLSGNTDAGIKLLLDNSAFHSSTLQQRRDTLLRSQAVMLSFKDSSDLQQLEFITGQPELGDGFLSGSATHLYEFHVRNTLSGGQKTQANQQWEMSCQLEFPHGLRSNAEVVLQIGTTDTSPIVVRINKQQITARIEGPDSEQEIPSSDFDPQEINTISIVYSNGSSSIVLNNKTLSQAAVTLPDQARFGFTSTGCDWKLNQLQVVGGH